MEQHRDEVSSEEELREERRIIKETLILTTKEHPGLYEDLLNNLIYALGIDAGRSHDDSHEKRADRKKAFEILRRFVLSADFKQLFRETTRREGQWARYSLLRGLASLCGIFPPHLPRNENTLLVPTETKFLCGESGENYRTALDEGTWGGTALINGDFLAKRFTATTLTPLHNIIGSSGQAAFRVGMVYVPLHSKQRKEIERCIEKQQGKLTVPNLELVLCTPLPNPEESYEEFMRLLRDIRERAFDLENAPSV